MTIEPLDIDISCVQCEYNLRGCNPLHSCPECGLDFVASLGWAYIYGDENRNDIIETSHRAIMTELGFELDGVIFVHEAVNFIVAGAANHFTALQIWRSICQYAKRFIGNEAEITLKQWGINRSEDIGRIVFALVKWKLIEASPGDSIDQFADLGTVSQELKNIRTKWPHRPK